jgi:hypothetical protein
LNDFHEYLIQHSLKSGGTKDHFRWVKVKKKNKKKPDICRGLQSSLISNSYVVSAKKNILKIISPIGIPF